MKSADVNHIYFDGRHYDSQHKRYIPDIPFWIRQARKYGEPILELACGTGRIAITLAEKGFQVTGIDISESMLSKAIKKSSLKKINVEWVKADMRDFSLRKKFSLIILPFNSVCHLLSLEDIEGCFSSARKHLKTGGRFIIDVFNPHLNTLLREPTKRYPHTTYVNPDGKEIVKVTQTNIYDDAAQINRIKLYYRIGHQKEKIEELNMRIFYPQEIDALVKYNGFIIERKIGNYDETIFKSGSPKQIIVCHR